MSKLELLEQQILQLSAEEISLLREKLDEIELETLIPALQLTPSNGKKARGLPDGIVSRSGASMSDSIRLMRDERENHL
jgi:hypothetical protein